MSDSSLETLVGEAVYSTWVEMLAKLAPDAPTGQLAVTIAAMLRYASELAFELEGGSASEGSPAYEFICADEAAAPSELAGLLGQTLAELLADAGVEDQRVSSRGESCRISISVFEQYLHWYDLG